jgi:hypothetical protein
VSEIKEMRKKYKRKVERRIKGEILKNKLG